MAMQLFRVLDGVSGPTMCFIPGQVLGLKPGDSLPPGLAGVCERLPDDTGVPVDVIRLDPAAMKAASTPRAEAVPAKPLSEIEVRKRCRLSDPALWSAAKQLGFPTPSMRRFERAIRPALGEIEIPLWQAPHVDAWLEHFRLLAPVIGRG